MPAQLVDHLDELALAFTTVRQVLLYTDFDGTLVPIKANPADCHLDPEVRSTLSTIAEYDHFSVGIISGREIEDLRARIGIDGISYAGNHGLEMHGPNFAFRELTSLSLRQGLDALVNLLEQSIVSVAGAWIEHKGLSATVHYRNVAPGLISFVVESVCAIVANPLDNQHFVVRPGKAVLEIFPAIDWHKGKAIRWLAKRAVQSDLNPMRIYLGDDTTDEDAFLEWSDGITICVGEKCDTCAKYTLKSPEQVHLFLKWLLTNAALSPRCTIDRPRCYS